MYIYIYVYVYVYMYIYIYIYIYVYTYDWPDRETPPARTSSSRSTMARTEASSVYGQFSKFNVCFCGLDPGTLKSDIVSKKHPQSICSDLRLSNWKFEDWNNGNRPHCLCSCTSRMWLWPMAVVTKCDMGVWREDMGWDDWTTHGTHAHFHT